MWLIPARALNKVSPSIFVFIASIDRIMHDTRLVVFSRITVSAIPVIVVEMDCMPMRRQFPFGQKSSPPWWQKLAEEYRICTLHVT